jgi:NhaC family Na+:H+ antiporter
LPAIFILLIVGSIIGTWILSGTIPAMIFYGLKFLSPSLFIPLAALITAIVSTTLGTSFTSIATVGIALIAVGNAMGFATPLTAAAIISGAFFGDKLSPFQIQLILQQLWQTLIFLNMLDICCGILSLLLYCP